MGSASRQRGMALLLVLMITAVLAVIISLQQYKTQNNIELASQTKDWMQAKAKLLTVKNVLIYRLSTDAIWLYGPDASRNAQAGLPVDTNFYGKTFQFDDAEVKLTDTSGMLGVVPFNRKAWQALLVSQNAEHIATILDSLEDWFDKDDFTHLYGAEKQDYFNPSFPRNDLPQTVDELLYVKGMTPELWQHIRPYLCYIGTAQLNPEFLPEALLEPMLGEYRAQLAQDARRSNENVNDMVKRKLSEEATFTPTNRLKVEIRVRINNSAAQLSFVLQRTNGVGKITQITEIQEPVFRDASS